MFKLLQAGREGGDCTAPYDVKLDKEYTVKEFVDAVLTRDSEWGYIGIIYRDAKSVFGDPHCEYSHGELLYNLPEEVLNRKVNYVNAHGGWSRMDYRLYLKKEG